MTHEPQTGVAMLQQAELILIMLEGFTGEELHEEGTEAADILDAMDLEPHFRDSLKAASTKLVDYFTRCLNDGGANATNMGVIKPGKGVQ